MRFVGFMFAAIMMLEPGSVAELPRPTGTAQQATAQQKTFMSPDGGFRFSHPKDFPICTKANINECTHSYISVCDDDALVCVVYPPERFADTNFGSAGFQVRKVRWFPPLPLPNTANVCVTPMPVVDANGHAEPYTDFFISADHPAEIIGGTSFIHGIRGGAATSHVSQDDLYRAFHDGDCYELRIRVTQAVYEVYDAGAITKFTPANQKAVKAAMSDILRTFRFVKH